MTKVRCPIFECIHNVANRSLTGNKEHVCQKQELELNEIHDVAVCYEVEKEIEE